MKGKVISSQHTLEIDGNQVDICYEFVSNEISIYVNGFHFTSNHFTPSFKVFNYVNLMDLAVKTLGYYLERKARKENELNSTNEE